MLGALFKPSLMRTLLVRTLLVAIVPVLLVTALAISVSSRSIFSSFEDETRFIASTLQNEIDNKVVENQRNAQFLANFPDVRTATEDRDGASLSRFLTPIKSRIGAGSVRVADLDGLVLAGAQDFSPGDRLNDQLVRLARATVEQSSLVVNEPSGLTVRSIALIRGRQTQPTGVLEVGADLDSDFLRGLRQSPVELVLLWDDQLRASTIDVADRAILPATAEVDAAPSDTLDRTVRIHGRDYYGVFTLIYRFTTSSPGMLGVLQPTTPVDTAERSLLAFLILAVAASAAVIAVLAYRSSRNISAPLRALATAAQQIEAGDLSVRIPRRSKDEIGTLERTFDNMAASLDERERLQQAYLAEARTMNAVADAIVGVTERGRIFAESLGRIIGLLGTTAAAVALRELPSPDSPRSAEWIAVPLATGVDPRHALAVAREVLATPNLAANAVRTSPASAGRLRFAAHVPLATGAGITGLLSVYFAEPRSLDESEARALRTLARLVSVATENADLVTELRANNLQLERVAKENADLVIELRENNEQLERASRLKSEFLASVSHELRTPMNAIIGYTKLMLDGIDGELSEQQATDLQRVASAADNLLVLINDLLDLAKIEAGRMEIRPEEVDLVSVASDVVELVRPAANAKHISVTSSITAALPTVFADPSKTRQIIANLMSNAVKFTERGGVAIDAVADDRWVTVTVRDTGIGIPADARDYIFDEFRQVDSSATRKYGGTGLGLAITRRLVELQGGRIWVESELGKGSTFHFTVPRTAARPAAAPRDAARSATAR
ncbi:MAG TPA: ATP-binding protein [Candidatus Dormibacteraeota bacterium]|nr:ATP-binding protein [Candidatus Dormibacteraeota bacterium]